VVRSTVLICCGALVAGVVACSGDSAGPNSAVVLAPCSATARSGGALNLPVGGVRAIGRPTDLACVRLAVSDTGADYLLVASNASESLDVVRHFMIEGRADVAGAMTAARVGAAPAIVAAPAGTPAPRHVLPPVDLGREVAIRAYERRHLRVPGAHVAALAERAGRASTAPLARAAVAASPVPTVGQTLPFRVPGSDSPCTSYDSVTAVVKFVGKRAILAQDLAAPAGGFADADFAAISDEFDRAIFPTDSSYFGTPSDIDANGHVVILFTPEINRLTRRGDAAFFAGFFFAGDLFPRTGPNGQGCPESNIAEIFYLLVPDPRGQFSDPHGVADVRQLTRGTVAHELQHMINAGGRLESNAPAFEQTWLDEGLAHFAEEAVGRAERGYGDLQELAFADVARVPADFDAFFGQNLLRFAKWLGRPDTSAGPSARTGDDISGRGAAWALVRYTSEKYSGGDVRAFTRRLVAGPDTGLTNLTRRAGVPYDSILPGYMLANFADGAGVPNLDARYTYSSWNMRDAIGGTLGAYPLRVNPLVVGAPPSSACVSSVGAAAYVCESRSGSAAYFRLATAVAGSGLAARLLDASDTTHTVFPEARLYVLRLR
jgi:hypothetical protein